MYAVQLWAGGMGRGVLDMAVVLDLICGVVLELVGGGVVLVGLGGGNIAELREARPCRKPTNTRRPWSMAAAERRSAWQRATSSSARPVSRAVPTARSAAPRACRPLPACLALD